MIPPQQLPSFSHQASMQDLHSDCKPTSIHPSVLRQDALNQHSPVKVKKSLMHLILSTFQTRLNQVEGFAEKKIPLVCKFFVIAAPTLVALIALSTYIFISGLLAVSASGKTDTAAAVSHCLMGMMTEFQTERAMSVGFVESNGRFFEERLSEQIVLSDRVVDSCMADLKQLERDELYEEKVEPVKYLIYALTEEREYNRVNSKALSVDDVQKHYNKLIDKCSELQADLARDIGKQSGVLPQAVSLMRHRTDLMTLQATYAMRRGEVTSVLLKGALSFNSSDTFSPALYEHYLTIREWIHTESYLLNRYQNIHSADSWKTMQENVLTLRAELTPYEANITQTPFANFSHLDVNDYFSKATNVIEAIQLLEDALYAQLVQSNQSYYTTNLIEMLVGLVVIVFFVIPITIIVCCVVRVTYRPIIRQKHDLRTASEIAKAITELDFESEQVKELQRKPLDQCEDLEATLRKVMENFLEYLPYIPRHLLVKDEGEDENRTEAGECASVQSDGVTSTKSSRSSKTQDTLHSSKNSSSNRSRRFSRASKKQATIMVIDITDFSRIASEMSFEGLSVSYSNFLTAIAETVYKTNGVVHSFSSGIFMCSWNAASTVFEPEKKASAVALELINSAFSNPKLSFRMKIGISSGEVTVGELGNQEMRAFQIIGDAMTRALALTKLCHQYRCSVAVDQNTFKVINFENDLKQLDFVNFPNTTVGEGIYELLRSKQIRSDEWLYEKEQAEQLNTFAEYNAAWKQALRGDYKSAREHINNFKEELESKSNNRGLASIVSTEYLEDIISHGESSTGFRYKCHLSNWKAVNNM